MFRVEITEMDLMQSVLNLHRVDSNVRGLRNRLLAAERYLAGQERHCAEVEGLRNEQVIRKRQTQASIGNAEVELAAADARIEKLRDELNSAVTNKQYSALLNELNTMKASRGAIEDGLLKDMEQIDVIDARIAELDDQLKERATVRESAKRELDERRADIGERLAELEQERSVAAAAVPAHALAVFDGLNEIYDGEAIAGVEEIDRRHRVYACEACNMQMPFEQVSRLLSGNVASVVQCNACNRILFMKEETRGALAKK